MNRRSDNDYYDLSNFDESLENRSQRRRQDTHRQNSGSRRPPQKTQRSCRLRDNRRRIRNRIIMVLGGILILVLFIFLITFMFRGCSPKKDTSNVSTKTIAEQISDSATPDSAKTEIKDTSSQTSVLNILIPETDYNISRGTVTADTRLCQDSTNLIAV